MSITSPKRNMHFLLIYLTDATIPCQFQFVLLAHLAQPYPLVLFFKRLAHLSVIKDKMGVGYR